MSTIQIEFAATFLDIKFKDLKMGMKFDNLDAQSGLKKLNGFLTTRSYVEGYAYSPADLDVFQQMAGIPEPCTVPHVYRWYIHIASIVGLRSIVMKAGKSTSAPVTKTAKKEEEEDDDDDMFGDDDDEDEEATKAAAKKRADAAKATKVKKKVIERSQVVLEVKPWEAETNLEELAIKIKATIIPGLKWGEGHKLVPVAYGIKKLLVQCVIIDDEVLIEDITDKIEAFEEYVQSVDVATMNKM